LSKLNLSGEWVLSYINAGVRETLPAAVPGSVYSDLLAGGRMEDPYYRDNELVALKLMENDYTYSRGFDLPEDFIGGGELRLVCEGLDTIADISLNGKAVGYADNMHRRWIFDIKDAVTPGENTIEIVLRSPTAYIKEQDAVCFADGSSDAMRGFPHIRKAHCMFGWDWGARLPDAGIWKEIYIEYTPVARIKHVLIIQRHEDGLAMLDIKLEIANISGEMLSFKAEVVSPCGETYSTVFEGEEGTLAIDRPELWYPNGYGSQPLYAIKVSLCSGNEIIDTWERRIGLRTLTVKRERDQWGESFEFNVNGISIFAMGADYIPEDHILPRMTPERTRILLEDCARANMNCVRVWGGAFYPFDCFYDICDELGLIVWEDFMFACAVIELTPAMKENIRLEIIDNIKRLRHHASLGLFCGNNEMEWQIGFKGWRFTPKQYGDYFRMYESMFPELTAEYAPQTFYWPASPSSGGAFDEPNDENRGDAHYWDVWHGAKPFTAYRNFHFRFVSEFGFQSFPDIKTIECFTLPEDRNVFSYVMEKHQRNASANCAILKYLGQTFLYPSDFKTLIYASQLLQAEAVKYGVEHFRRNRGRCMGAIYWQLNDCWPVASWASVDYFGRWKALHYYAKRFFAPILLSAKEEGFLTQGADVNSEPFDYKKSVALSVANETLNTTTVEVCWTLRTPDAGIVYKGSREISVSPLTSVWMEEMDFGEADMYGNYVSFELKRNNEIISEGTVLFCPPKHFRFVDPKLKVQAAGDTITVSAEAYAKSVEIYGDDSDFLLSDNFFDMNAGEKSVRILRGEAGSARVRSVYDIR
jgi:beta-mannosidase